MENIQSVPIAASISDSSDSTSGLTINDLNKKNKLFNVIININNNDKKNN